MTRSKGKSKIVFIRKRDCLLESLKDIKNFIENFDITTQEKEVGIWIKSLNSINSRLETLIEEVIEDCDDEFFAEFQSSISHFNSDYVSSLSSLENLIPKSPTLGQQDNNKVSVDIKIPFIDIPTFDGTITEWLNFKNSYVSIIHNKSDLNDISKFTYLLSKLKGEPKEFLGHINLSSEGYNRAWNDLLRRYENKRIIIYKHLDAISDIKQIGKNNVSELKVLYNTCVSNLSSLEALNYKIDGLSEQMLIHMVVKKLDFYTRSDWEKELCANELPTWKKFIQFIEHRCTVIDTLKVSYSNSTKEPIRNKTKSNDTKSYFITKNEKGSSTNKLSKPLKCQENNNKSNVDNNKSKCPVCSEVHSIFQCTKFLNLSTLERNKQIRTLKLCTNCLKGIHTIKDCWSFNVCKICNQKHNSLLHIEPSSSQDAVPEGTSSNDPQAFCVNSTIVKTVFLPTALVLIKTNNNKYIECRALLDSGSQCNFITNEFAQRLNLNQEFINSVCVTGINHSNVSTHKKVTSTIKSKNSNFAKDLEFLVIPSISKKLPQRNINISQWEIPKEYKLADPHFYCSRPIDILLGSETFFNIILPSKFNFNDQSILLQDSVFGLLFTGSYQEPIIQQNFALFQNDNNSNSLDQIIKSFWELDSFQNKTFYSADEQRAEENYKETFTRNETGRYIVSLPFKENVTELGSSRKTAVQRFNYVEGKFKENDNLKEQYVEFMKDYINLGHMKLIPIDKLSDSIPHFYLPHHSILKPSSSTTKLRVVFDGSSNSSSGKSLNDILLVGPKINQDIFSIILRFRKFPIVFTADIKKMYRQIILNENQTQFHRILWRFDSNQPIDTYELTTVTYGTSCAPFLAVRTIHQLALDERKKYPIASKILKRDMYIDDILSGANTLDEALIIQSQLISMLNDGGFHLHKWCSNNSELLEKIPHIDRENLHTLDSKINESIKTLGIRWQPDNDVFYFDVKLISLTNNTFTKRIILSDIARLYDPLGLLSPVIVKAKIIMQKIWKYNLNWDEIVPSDITQDWKTFIFNLNHLNSITIPRNIMQPQSRIIELHGFSDASEMAYGACVYIKTITDNNTIKICLVCSKSRIAPLKTVSLPRLELCGALLLSNLISVVKETMLIDFHSITLWTDSTITLHWIRTSPHLLKTFVANRVAEIQGLTSNFQWKHVSSTDNPADIITRGLWPHELNENKKWWNGPSFLTDPEINFQNEFSIPENTNLEFKVISLPTVIDGIFNFLERYDSFQKLQRVTAYCLRFSHNCQQKHIEKRILCKSLSVQEMENSLKTLIGYVQKNEWSTEISNLIQHKQLNLKSNIKNLNPFLDEDSLLRVGGRLSNSELDFDHKHPYLLPAKSILTKLIFKHYHLKYHHVGEQLLISLIRNRFWPINARVIAKSTIRNCINCFRTNPKPSNQIMGNLPIERISPARPFSTTGMDFCGPFFVKDNFHRKSSPRKVYICLFICFVVKAIHLEIALDMTSQSFIACLKRFIYRRGKPHTLWSDNGSNFVGAKNELKRINTLFLDQLELNGIQNYCVNEEIEFKFIPPRSPNFGGLWESSIKLLKTHLKRVTLNKIFTYEEFHTLIIEIEGIINSRPISPLSSDPNDPSPLTPSHFLTGGPIIGINEKSYENEPSNRLKSWQRVTQCAQSFWRRYKIEYLHNLQQRQKWKSEKDNINVGDVVLMLDNNLPSTHWLLGVIEKVYLGNDKMVRVVEVKTSQGLYKRAISKVCKLPFE